MTPEEVDRVARNSAQESLRQLFMLYGVDVTDAKSVKSFQADLQFLSRQRQGAEEARRWIRRAAITAFVSGLLWVLWEGAKQAIK